MYYDYGYSDPAFESAIIAVLVVCGVILAFAMILGVVFYVMRSLSLYTIAKRRGVNNPWLAWLPIGTEWIIGSLSDQYQYVVKDRVRSKRKVLLGLSAAVLVCSVVSVVRAVGMVVELVMTKGMMSSYGSDAMIATTAMSFVLLSLVLSVVAIVMMVFKYICMFDVYRSCDPGNGVVFLVLSIVFNFLEPIFLLVVRKKDDGMPPRRDAQPVPRPIEAHFNPDRPEPWDQ